MSPFLDSGMCVLVFHNNKQKAIVVPGYGTGTYWDIGIIAKKFIETNVISNHRPSVPQFAIDDY